MSESIIIKQSILMNRFYPIQATIFIWEFYFRIIDCTSNILKSCHFVIQVNENPDISVKAH